MKPDKILIPTDFSECSNKALDLALLLAQRFAASLHLLHVVVMHSDDPFSPVSQLPDAGEIYQRLEELAASEMRDLLSARPADTLDVRTVQRQAVAAAPDIVEYAEEKQIDLLVMGAHGRRGFRRFLLGSVTEEVVRLAPCPVLTLRATEETEIGAWRTLLVPYDFSDQSKLALRTAREIAEGDGSRIVVLHVVEPPLDPQIYAPVHDRYTDFDSARLAKEIRGFFAEQVEEILGSAVDHEIEVVEGNAGAQITEAAERWGADLIVISTHGWTGWQRFVLGSVTERVVRSASCPVLTLKVAS